ncbi:MAG: TonB-dependent siderophore receptor [Panacagrimonas sp.]
MWKKTLLAAAVAGFTLSTGAAEPEPQAAPKSEPAAPPKDDAPVKVDTITVTGERPDKGFKAEDQVSSKLPLTIRETPQSITVFTRESLDDRQVFNLQQALELSAGVTQFSGTGPFGGQPSFGFNQTTIRGIPIDDEYDFRDDGFVSGSYFSVPDLAIYERVEVVKGANSMLYGRGSIGGLINRVRKKPLAERRTEMELSAGSYDTWRGDVDITGPLLDSTKARGRLVAVYEDSGSFVRGVDTQRTVLAPSAEFDLTPTTRLLVQALHQSESIIPNTGLALRRDGSNFKAPDISRRQYNGIATRDPYEWTIDSVMVQLDQELGDRWLASLRLSNSNNDTPIRTDAYVYGFREEGDDPATADVVERRGDTTIAGNDFAIDRDIFSGELQFNGRIDIAGREAKLGFGADFNENQYSRRGMYTDFATTGNLYDDDFPQPNPGLFPGFQTSGEPRSFGAYAQAQIPLGERLKILLGARYDEVRLSNIGYHAVDGEAPPRARETLDDVTGRVGLTYDINTQISLYSVYAQSFRPELFAMDINDELLDPETGEIYELGAKTEWFNRRLGVNAAIYRVDRDNIAVSADVPQGTKDYSVSSGLQRSDGMEIEVNGRPLPGWDVSAVWNTVNSDFKDRRDAFFGHQPGGTANWQMGLYSAYELQQGPVKGLGVGATVYVIDDRGVSTFTPGTIPGYERLDLHAFYKGFRNVEINLLVRNVTDETYIEGADRPGAIAFFGSPAAALLSVKYSL